jgi:aconitate hydratase
MTASEPLTSSGRSYRASGRLRAGASDDEIPVYLVGPLMHSTTVDIAASRTALAKAGGDPTRLSLVLPADVSTDHAVAGDFFGSSDALSRNMERELIDRYRFTKWAASALGRQLPCVPATGVIHTINMEHLTSVVAFDTIEAVSAHA